MKRNYGIDALRIVSMVFVIVLHLMGVGGVCANSQLFSPQFLLSQLLRIGTFSAVNCYALISGFVGWDRKPKLSGLATLWLKAVLFCLAITAFFARTNDFDYRTWLNALLPVTTGQYWYLTAYVGLFVLMPILNFAIANMPKKDLMLTLSGILLLFCILPISPLTDAFYLHDGYSVLWLAVVYLLGGYLGKYELLDRLSPGKWLLVFLCAVVFAWAPRMLALAWKPRLWYDAYGNILIEYTSPAIVLAAAALLAVFSRLRLSEGSQGIVAKISPCAFGVYLLHAHPLVFRHVLENRFAHLGTGSIGAMIGSVLLWTAVICAAGIAADAALTALLKLLKVDRLLKKLDTLL